jgi:hypothetical protein
MFDLCSDASFWPIQLLLYSTLYSKTKRPSSLKSLMAGSGNFLTQPMPFLWFVLVQQYIKPQLIRGTTQTSGPVTVPTHRIGGWYRSTSAELCRAVQSEMYSRYLRSMLFCGGEFVQQTSAEQCCVLHEQAESYIFLYLPSSFVLFLKSTDIG